MYNHSANPQVIHSLTAMSDALVELLKTKPLQKVRVSQICEQASVSRRTFYRNVDELLDLIDFKVDRAINEQIQNTNFDEPNEIILYRRFFEYWYAHRTFLTVLYARGMFARFESRFVELFIDGPTYRALQDFLDGKENSVLFQPYHSAYVVGGFCAVLEYWIRDGFTTSIDILTETVSAFTPSLT